MIVAECQSYLLRVLSPDIMMSAAAIYKCIKRPICARSNVCRVDHGMVFLETSTMGLVGGIFRKAARENNCLLHLLRCAETGLRTVSIWTPHGIEALQIFETSFECSLARRTGENNCSLESSGRIG